MLIAGSYYSCDILEETDNTALLSIEQPSEFLASMTHQLSPKLRWIYA